MSNRQTLFVLIGFAALALIGKLWSESHLSYWEETLLTHQRRYKLIWEECDNLELRREKAPKGTDEQSFRLHFQTQAYTAQMGDINVTVRSRQRTNYQDQTFTLEFARDENGFRRDQLRTFLFNSELLYPRMRTTSLVLQPHSQNGRRGVESGVERLDLWDIKKLEMRQRSPLVNN